MELVFAWAYGVYTENIEDAGKISRNISEEEVPMIRVGTPYYYVPTVDAERAINDIIDYDLDDEIAEYSEDYLLLM